MNVTFDQIFQKIHGAEMVVLPAAPLFIEMLLLHLSFYSQKYEVL